MDGVREQCAYVGRIQLAIAWEHLVYETFHAEPPTGANTRRRMLVLALGAAEHPVPKSAIVELTPALTRAYAVKTAKTLTPRPQLLLDRDLVLRSVQGYRARVERMHSFQPATAR